MVNIDRGTTNRAVNYRSIEELKSKEKPERYIFHIPKLIEKSEVADMQLFPSFFTYLAPVKLPMKDVPGVKKSSLKQWNMLNI